MDILLVDHENQMIWYDQNSETPLRTAIQNWREISKNEKDVSNYLICRSVTLDKPQYLHGDIDIIVIPDYSNLE